jgi:hypothetical protein
MSHGVARIYKQVLEESITLMNMLHNEQGNKLNLLLLIAEA